MTSSPPNIPCMEGNRGTAIVGIGATFIAIGTILTGLRVFTRIRLVAAGLGWDDAFIVIALKVEALAIADYGLCVKQVQYGLGRHAGCLSPAEIISDVKFQYISEVPLVLSTLFSRVSICFFLLRLFAINISWRWTLYVIIGLTTAANVASATIILIQCEPTAKLWNPMLPGTCWKPGVQVAIGQFQGVLSAILDLTLSALPVYCMWKIQLSWRIKAAVCGIMSLGVLTAGCVLARTVLLSQIKGQDISWEAAGDIVWANLEAQVAIIAACIATLRPFFTRFTRKSSKPTRRKPSSSESETRLHCTKASSNPYARDKWLGGGMDGTGSSHRAVATAGQAHEEGFSLENLDGIRRVVEVDVSV